jgi:2,3-bisphosphoglycerate-dependent phosphoglycerate mutase
VTACELILVRHGVTAWNRERRFQGQIDTPLSAEGLEQARLAARRLAREPIVAVYSSNLARAWQTAEPIAESLRLPVVSEPGLRERAYGSFEGLTFDEIKRDLPDAYQRWQSREPEFELPGSGESLRGFHARIEQTLDVLARRHPGETIVLVTHGGVLDSAYRIASGLPLSAARRFDLFNASFNSIRRDEDGFRIRAWGDVAHLADSLDDIEARD